MLERGMILSENRYLRENMSKRIQYILTNLHNNKNPTPKPASDAASVPVVAAEDV